MIAYITEIDKNNYTSFIDSNELVLIFVYASWCQICNSLHPIIDQLSCNYNNKLCISKLNYDLNKEISDFIQIRNVPAIIIYKNGNIIEKIIGDITYEQLSVIIENI